MGVGKTTLGKKIADRIAYPFKDIDQQIERQFNMPTSQLFNQLGEKTFREAERELTLRYMTSEQIVLSLGGGAFLQREIKEACLTQSTVIYIEMGWEHWQERLDFLIHNRPLLQGKNKSEIKQLFTERLSYYQDYHHKVNIDGLTIESATDKVLKAIGKDKI